MSAAVLTLSLLFGVTLGSPVGWKLARCPVPAVPARGSQETLSDAVQRFARAWEAEDVDALMEAVSERSVRLQLPDEDLVEVPARQARAAIRSLFRRYRGGEMAVERLSPSRGDPAQGFAQVRWSTVATAGGDPVTFTLFLALVEDAGTWKVTEIRTVP